MPTAGEVGQPAANGLESGLRHHTTGRPPDRDHVIDHQRRFQGNDRRVDLLAGEVEELVDRQHLGLNVERRRT
eukprot:15456744-Alexandrium_andersonii.AAC.1